MNLIKFSLRLQSSFSHHPILWECVNFIHELKEDLNRDFFKKLFIAIFIYWQKKRVSHLPKRDIFFILNFFSRCLSWVWAFSSVSFKPTYSVLDYWCFLFYKENGTLLQANILRVRLLVFSLLQRKCQPLTRCIKKTTLLCNFLFDRVCYPVFTT